MTTECAKVLDDYRGRLRWLPKVLKFSMTTEDVEGIDKTYMGWLARVSRGSKLVRNSFKPAYLFKKIVSVPAKLYKQRIYAKHCKHFKVFKQNIQALFSDISTFRVLLGKGFLFNWPIITVVLCWWFDSPDYAIQWPIFFPDPLIFVADSLLISITEPFKTSFADLTADALGWLLDVLFFSGEPKECSDTDYEQTDSDNKTTWLTSRASMKCWTFTKLFSERLPNHNLFTILKLS